MNKITIKLNDGGIRSLLKSQEMSQALQGIAEQIASNCGPGYSYDQKEMQTRIVASVYTETSEAMDDNSANNTIMRRLK